MNSGYRKRVADDYFRERMKVAGALLIEGLKWCGKTTTGEELCSSTLYMQNPNDIEYNLHYAEKKPSVLLEEEKSRLTGEWRKRLSLS